LVVLAHKDPKTGGEDPLTWDVSIPTDGSSLRLEVTIPQTRYQLPPILLNNNLLSLYSDVHAVKVYDARPPPHNLGRPIGELGWDFEAKVTEGDFTQVNYNDGQPGWIYVPELQGDITVVDYVAGVIRLLRWDYLKAIEMLRKSAASGKESPLKIDSLLLQALATAKLKKNPGPLIESAEQLNPYLQTTAKYKIVWLISRVEAASAKHRQAAISSLANEIAAKDYLFGPDDQWLATARKILAVFQR
jgi:hypothetical protein